jgi:hypothetical protein
MSSQLDQNPMAIEPVAIARLRPYPRNARAHSKKQIRQIADSIEKFGFTNPVLISDDDEIICRSASSCHSARSSHRASMPDFRRHVGASSRDKIPYQLE